MKDVSWLILDPGKGKHLITSNGDGAFRLINLWRLGAAPVLATPCVMQGQAAKISFSPNRYISQKKEMASSAAATRGA